MNRLRLLGSFAVIGGAAVLSGCVAYPTDSYDPYYGSYGGTAVVPAPSVYIEGGSYYGGRPYYGGPGYYGRPGYYDPRPGYPRAPGWQGRPPGPGAGWNGAGGGRPARPPAGVPRAIIPEQPLPGSIMQPRAGGGGGGRNGGRSDDQRP